MTPRGRFLSERRSDIKRAADAIERELVARHFNVQTSTCLLIAIHACAAFANVPETPASVKLENLRRALSEDDALSAAGQREGRA